MSTVQARAARGGLRNGAGWRPGDLKQIVSNINSLEKTLRAMNFKVEPHTPMGNVWFNTLGEINPSPAAFSAALEPGRLYCGANLRCNSVVIGIVLVANARDRPIEEGFQAVAYSGPEQIPRLWTDAIKAAMRTTGAELRI